MKLREIFSKFILNKNTCLKDFLVSGQYVWINSIAAGKMKLALILKNYREFQEIRGVWFDRNEKKKLEISEDNDTGVHENYFYRYFALNIDTIVELSSSTYNVKQSLEFDKQDYCFIKKQHFKKIAEKTLLLENAGLTEKYNYTKAVKNDFDSMMIVKEYEQLRSGTNTSLCNGCAYENEHMSIFAEEKKLRTELENVNKALSEENLKHFDNFKKRVNILKAFEYIDQDDQVTLKGKAAREISTSDSLLLTELLLSGILEKLDTNELIAFLSGFAYSLNEVNFEDPTISRTFTDAMYEFQDLYEDIIEKEKAFEFEEDKLNRKVVFTVSWPIYEWMQGKSFTEVCLSTDLEEGKLYNLIMRLMLFCEEIKNFFETLGNIEKADMYAKARMTICRDVISCKSLYLQDIDLTI